jgi:hypothetical protein
MFFPSLKDSLSSSPNWICRFISFEELRQRLAQVKDFVQYLKPDFLEELSEACDLEQGVRPCEGSGHTSFSTSRF